MFRVGNIVEMLLRDETSVPDIESHLNSDDSISKRLLRKTNYNSIKMKLKTFENMGDITDQLDIAQLVARHLCTRYRSQLMCLKRYYDDNTDETMAEQSSYSSWCCCVSGNTDDRHGSRSHRSYTPQDPRASNDVEVLEKLAIFAIAFVIQSINNNNVRISSEEKLPTKDALASTLVLTVSRAYTTINIGLFSSFISKPETIPIDPTALAKVLK